MVFAVRFFYSLGGERYQQAVSYTHLFFKSKNEDYKVELIQDLPEDAVISCYSQGDFIDLCAGPHVASTGKVKAFKLQSIAGAYWRGDEKNKMLQRIYGTAFEMCIRDSYFYVWRQLVLNYKLRCSFILLA